MSAQLSGHVSTGRSVARVQKQKASYVASRGSRLRGVIVRAATKKAEAEPFGTQLLKGLTSLSGTISLKPNKNGTSLLQSFTGSISRNGAKAQPDVKTAFVAGATGRTGARVVRELLKAGLKVRAGVRDVDAAQQSLDVAVAYGLLTAQDVKSLQLVQIDYSKPDSIKTAIGNARKVVCALGAAESEALNFSNPKKVDGEYTIALINAAAAQGVEQFVMVSSLGTGKIGFPASVLNLFGGVLFWKREAEKALEASGMAYTIVRPGGMERPTDSHKKTHNMVLSTRDSTFGGTVSRLQVAELIGTVLTNPELAANKVLEVTSATDAPALSYEELLSSIEPDVSRESQLEYKEKAGAVQEKVSEAEDKVSAARSALAAADSRIKELQERLKTAKAQEKEVQAQVAPVLKEGASAEKQLETATAAAEKAALRESAARAVLEAAKKAGSQGQLLDKKQLAAVADQVLNPPRTQSEAAGAGAAANNGTGGPLGGLSGLFGSLSPAREVSPAPAAAEDKEEPKKVQQAAVPATPSPAPAAPVKAAAPAPAVAKKTAVPPKQQEQADEDEEEEVRDKSPSPFAAFANFFKPVIVDAEPTSAPAKAEEKEAAPAEKKKQEEPASDVVVVGKKEEKKEQPPAPAPAPVPAPAAAAKPAVAEKKQAPAPAAPPKPAAPVDDAADVEARMLAALAEERRAKAIAEAKAKLAVESKAVQEIKGLAAKITSQKAPSQSPEPEESVSGKPAPFDNIAEPSAKPAAKPVEKPAAEQKPADKPAAEKKPVEKKPAAGPSDAEIAAEKKKVQAWIAAWQAKQKAGESGKEAVPVHAAGGAPAGNKKAEQNGYDADSAAKAKAEAQQWIAAWQAKQKN